MNGFIPTTSATPRSKRIRIRAQLQPLAIRGGSKLRIAGNELATITHGKGTAFSRAEAATK